MSGRIDATTLLGRALSSDAASAGIAAEIAAATSRRWASATFVGARHRLTVTGADIAAAREWLGALPDADLPLRGHLVADLVVIGQDCEDGRFTATIEALTVEEA